MCPVFLAGLFLFLLQQIEMMIFDSKLRAPNRVNAEFRKHRLAAFCAGIVVLFLILCDGSFAAQTSAARAALPPGRELTDEVGLRVQIPREVDCDVSRT